jgi:ribonuclease Z
MTFELTILGCGAAAPTGKFHPSSQLLNMHDKLFLIDCGEGTQMQMRKFKLKMQRVNHIFISHLHGDHYLGLMGFISSISLWGRKADLTIYGPPELKEIIDIQLKASQTFLEYQLHVLPTSFEEKTLIYEDKSLEVYSFPLKHRINCCGFQFVEKQRLPAISKERIAEFKLRPSDIISLKHGMPTTTEAGLYVTPEMACTDAPIPRRYSYCSDTAFSERVIESVRNSNLLYHESTFLESERKRAKETFHSTAMQAAEVAQRSESKRLLLGHFSSRYPDEKAFTQEAKTIFTQSQVAEEGRTYIID